MGGGPLLLLLVSEGDDEALASFLSSASAVGVGSRVLVAALDAEIAAAARRLSPPPAVWEAAAALQPGMAPPARKWSLAAILLAHGVSVFYSSIHSHLRANPFEALYHDADIEAASSGDSAGMGSWLRGASSSERGGQRVAMDSIMGWSQMCESYQVCD